MILRLITELLLVHRRHEKETDKTKEQNSVHLKEEP